MPKRNSSIILNLTTICMITLFFFGISLYVYQNKENQYSNEKINCNIDNHIIFRTVCNINDDDDYFKQDCFGLEIECSYNNDSCYYSTGYYKTYDEANKYFNKMYTLNESIIAYITDNNDNTTCSFNDPYSNTKKLELIKIFSLIIVICIVILSLILCYQIKYINTQKNIPINDIESGIKIKIYD